MVLTSALVALGLSLWELKKPGRQWVSIALGVILASSFPVGTPVGDLLHQVPVMFDSLLTALWGAVSSFTGNGGQAAGFIQLPNLMGWGLA